MTRRLLQAFALLASTALVASAALFAAIGIGRLSGYHTLTVMSGSMEPTLHPGDIVAGHRISAVRARPGDVISFRDPQDSQRVLTHRVVRVRVVGTNLKFVTKGDANTGTERWQIPVGGTIGSVSVGIPKVGYLLFWLRTPLGRLAFVVLPILLLGAAALARIWRPPAEPMAA